MGGYVVEIFPVVPSFKEPPVAPPEPPATDGCPEGTSPEGLFHSPAG